MCGVVYAAETKKNKKVAVYFDLLFVSLSPHLFSQVAIKVVDIDELHKVYLDYNVPFKTVSKLVFNELKILKLLHHPNIVQLHESFQLNHTVFMVMEYIDGCDLLSIIPESGMSEDRAREFFLPLCAGVEYCHAHNVPSPSHLLDASSNSSLRVLRSSMAI